MKNRFKILSTSLIVTLSFASSQASCGGGVGETDQEISSRSKITWKKRNVGDLSKLPQDVGKTILAMAIYDQTIETGKSPGNIEATCKVFRDLITEDTKKFNENIIETSKLPFNTRTAFLDGLKVHYDLTTPQQIEEFERVYKGKLIYRPNYKSNVKNDNGKIELKISEWKHPFKGEFDISKCGGIKELSINMGYRKAINPNNANKVEVWIAPGFAIEQGLDTTAKHLKPIMNDRLRGQAPVVMFLTQGTYNIDYYQYITYPTLDELGDEDLNLIAMASKLILYGIPVQLDHDSTPPLIPYVIGRHFHISFVN